MKKIYSLIKENIVIKFTKNTFSNILRVVLNIVSFVLIIVSFALIFPDVAISIIEKNGEVLSYSTRSTLIEIFPYIGYFILGLVVLFISISVLLKKNNRKRTIIYELTKLIDEVILYMKRNVEEEKKKYEYFVDSVAEIKNKIN